jgi:hypothetical protein
MLVVGPLYLKGTSLDSAGNLVAMKDFGRLNSIKVIKVLAAIFFVATWLLMCGNSVNLLIKNNAESGFGPLDVVRRITAPDGKKTAILVRSYRSFLDLNFALYVTDDEMADVTDSTEKASFVADDELASMNDAAIWIKRALWISHDYEPTTSRNWHEDIVWSNDGSIIAVTIEGQYVFAYNLGTEQRYEEAEEIHELLKLHSN